MNRARAIACAAGTLAVAVGAVLANGQLPEAWRHWQFSRAVALGGTEQPRLVSVRIPWAVFSEALPDLADLRVIDDQGGEVPFILYRREGSRTERARAAEIGEISLVQGEFTQVVADTGSGGEFYNAIDLDTPADEFLAWVEVAVSDDAVRWRSLADRLPVFRFRAQGREGLQTLRFSETNARYIRLRVRDGESRFPITAIRVVQVETTEPELDRLPVGFDARQSTAEGASQWVSQGDVSGLPVAELRFEVGDAQFHRAVELASSADGSTWQTVATGEIFRIRRDEREYQRLALPIAPAAHAASWRVIVRDGNDPPLSGIRLSLHGNPHRAVFRQQPGSTYRLVYGHVRASAPEYDLARVTSQQAIERAVSGTAGRQEANSNYADPRPWTERRPDLLWGVLALAVALLGLFSLRALRRAT